ncbi:hypothetical protein D3C86_1626810 [compost metagenome]
MLVQEVRQRHQVHAGHYIGLDQRAHRLASAVHRTQAVVDVERSVRPGGLGQVLDRAGEAAGAFYQQHVAHPQGGGEVFRRERRQLAVAWARPRQVAGQTKAKGMQQ